MQSTLHMFKGGQAWHLQLHLVSHPAPHLPNQHRPCTSRHLSSAVVVSGM